MSFLKLFKQNLKLFEWGETRIRNFNDNISIYSFISIYQLNVGGGYQQNVTIMTIFLIWQLMFLIMSRSTDCLYNRCLTVNPTWALEQKSLNFCCFHNGLRWLNYLELEGYGLLAILKIYLSYYEFLPQNYLPNHHWWPSNWKNVMQIKLFKLYFLIVSCSNSDISTYFTDQQDLKLFFNLTMSIVETFKSAALQSSTKPP